MRQRTCNDWKASNSNILLAWHCTSAIKAISIQQVPYPTAAGKATNSIGTDLFTSSIGSVTLIEICRTKIALMKYISHNLVGPMHTWLLANQDMYIHLQWTQCYKCRRNFQLCLCKLHLSHSHPILFHTPEYLQHKLNLLLSLYIELVYKRRIYLYSWTHLLQSLPYMRSWSFPLCQCSWHGHCMGMCPVHTHWYLQIVINV